MTERTHDLAALTALTIALVIFPLTPMTIGTLGAAVIANQIGSAVPDFDQSTAEFYRELPAGSLIGKLMSPLFGGHRFISHSLIGLGLVGWGVRIALTYLQQFLIIDMEIVWGTFMIGYISHLVADTLTKEGVPWLFPIAIRFGFPPIKSLRVRTGKFMETLAVYPALVALNGYLIYTNYSKFHEFFTKYLVR